MSKHTWLPDERDALRLLFFEYSLTPFEAHRIFVELFPWVEGLLSEPINEWDRRDDSSADPTWRTVHHKSFALYTPQEDANRLRVRGLLLNAADDVFITLRPIPNAAAQHNAAIAFAIASGAPPRQQQTAPVPPPVSAPAPAGIAAPPAGAPTDIIEISSTSSQSSKSSIHPRSRQASPRLTLPEEDNIILYMVHQSDLAVFEDQAGQRSEGMPRFRCGQSQRFGPEVDIYARGGLVIRAFLFASTGGELLRRIEDVMVCRASECEVCLQRADYMPYTTQGSSEDTGGMPFVHISACSAFPTGNVVFQAALSTPIPYVASWGYEGKTVTYYQGSKSLTVTSAVCIRSSCKVCSSDVPRAVSVPFNRDPYSPADLPPLDPSGYALLNENTNSDPSRGLSMVHYKDMVARSASDGDWVEGEYAFRTQHQFVFRDTDPMWSLGGLVYNVRISGGTFGTKQVPEAEYHVMMCDRWACNRCTHLNTPATPFFQNRPMVHSGTCANRPNQSIFTPNWSTLLRPTSSSRSRSVTYFEAGNSLSVESRICRSETCSLCSPNRPDPRPKNIANSLHMVHRRDVTPYRGDGTMARYTCQYGDTFGREVEEWHHGGPILRVFIPDISTSDDDATSVTRTPRSPIDAEPAGDDWDVMLCQLESCKTCTPRGAERRPYKPYRVPFAHLRLGFQDLQDDVEDCDVDYGTYPSETIRYLGSATPGGTAVQGVSCIPETCAQCSAVEGGERQASNKRSGDPLEGPSPKRPRTLISTSGGQQGDVAGSLRMVHLKDLDRNEDAGGNLVPGQPQYITDESLTFGPESSIWRRGGYAINALVISATGEPDSEWHLMVCDCTDCARGVPATGASPVLNRPFVHATECSQGQFSPPSDSQALDVNQSIQRMVPTAISFVVAGSRIAVPAAVCDPATCSFCSPDPAQVVQTPQIFYARPAFRNLRMVHWSDLRPNAERSGNENMQGVPVYSAAYSKTFDDTNGDSMYAQGGPVMNIFVTAPVTGTDRDFNVMICDVRACSFCKDSTTSWYESGVVELEQGGVYGGQPFIHRNDTEQIGPGTMFRPSWNSDLYKSTVVAGRHGPRTVIYFEGGTTFRQNSRECVPSTCPVCRPDDSNILWMVHRSSLTRNTPDPARDDQGANLVRYACFRSAMKGPEDPEWHYGGPVMKVFAIGANSALYDVMLCQFQTCAFCVYPGRAMRAHTDYRLPFVHVKDCVEYSDGRPMIFAPDTGINLDQGEVPQIERRLVKYSQRSRFAIAQPVMSAVCIKDACDICLAAQSGITIPVAECDEGLSLPPPYPAQGPERTSSSTIVTQAPARTTRSSSNSRAANNTRGVNRTTNPPQRSITDLTEDLEEPAPTLRTTAIPATSKGDMGPPPPVLPSGPTLGAPQPKEQRPKPAAGGKSAPAAPPTPQIPTGTLRMCHKKQLTFNATNVQYLVDTKTKRNGGGTVDQYFVSDPDVRKWGGCVYRVDFPDNTTRDVMACQLRRCVTCYRKNKTQINQSGTPSNAPFVHRRDLNSAALNPVPSFTPAAGPYVYWTPPATSSTTATPVYPQGGPSGATAISAPSLVCEAGSCSICDPKDEADRHAAEEDEHDEDDEEDIPAAEEEEDDLYDVSPRRTTRRRTRLG